MDNQKMTSDMDEDIQHANKHWTSWLPAVLVIGIILGAGGLYIYQSSKIAPKPAVTENTPENVGDQPETETRLAGPNAIVLTDFTPGNTVNVNTVVLEKPGFVVVHEDSAGAPGESLGVSELLSSGENKGIGIMLNRESVDGEILYALLHFDDEDKEFDPAEDEQVKDVDGNPIMAPFIVGEENIEGEEISF